MKKLSIKNQLAVAKQILLGTKMDISADQSVELLSRNTTNKRLRAILLEVITTQKVYKVDLEKAFEMVAPIDTMLTLGIVSGRQSGRVMAHMKGVVSHLKNLEKEQKEAACKVGAGAGFLIAITTVLAAAFLVRKS